MNQAFQLSRLQKIDTQIDQASHRLKEIGILLGQSEKLQQAQAAFEQAQQTHKKASSELKKVEDEVETQRIKLETSEHALYGGKIRNPKELQDLQSEVASIKRRIAALEDQQFEKMEKLDTAETGLKEAKAKLAQVQSEEATEKASLSGEKSSLEKNIERLKAERDSVLSSVSPDDLQIYDQLRASKRGIAVAMIVEESCNVCGSDLRPELRQAARSPLKLSFCSSCGRILYAG
jgi:predicted  nucleic acid-binding Zn-ribbon protein